ncbi:MAG: hypothetical protein PHH24_00710 [Candidatus Moranbacteria bacterium]|nr:hypothetical protein [Candidatus Moranbacteria bacterium]
MLNKNDFESFNIFLLFWLALGWLAFIITLLGAFYWWILVLFIALVVALGIRFFLKPLLKSSRTFVIVNLSLFIIVTAFSVYVNPTVFSGRDQGSISEAAIRLSQNNQLEFSNPVSRDFFEINSAPRDKMAGCIKEKGLTEKDNRSLKEKLDGFYCHADASGKALNFPGFFYTPDGNLSTQFPLVYISWLSFFYSFLGLAGFIIANAILLYIFLLSIFLISFSLAKPLGKKEALFASIATLSIVATSFSFFWFAKFTLTENMALALLWIGILQMIYLTGSKVESFYKNAITLLVLFMSFGLLVFTRIEGLAFFVAMIFILLLHKNTARYFRINFLKIILPAIALLVFFFAWNLVADVYFYKAIIKALAKDFSGNAAKITGDYAISSLNLFKIFALYGILAPLLLGFVSVIYFFKKRDYVKLVPFFIALPSFIYILNPQITPDHPWMLRRFVFAVLPAAILYSPLLLCAFFKKPAQALYYKIILLFIIILNLPAAIYFFSYVPGMNLMEDTRNISQNFTENDLILVDQKSGGNSQEMIAAPMNFLFEKNAVYFFNPDDLKRLNTQKYEKIYLITPKSNVKYYKESYLGDKLISVNSYSFVTNALIDPPKDFSFPKKENIHVKGEIFEIKK